MAGRGEWPILLSTKIALDHGVVFIMNNRPDIAAELDCGSMQIGEEEASCAEARRLIGPPAIAPSIAPQSAAPRGIGPM